MTDRALRLHTGEMPGLGAAPSATRAPAPVIPARSASVSFVAVYDEHFPFVWRSVQRLGVHPAHADDAVQEVFVVVHRRLKDFEARSSLRTWLYGISVRVARLHRARAARRDHDRLDAEQLTAPEEHRPDRQVEDREAASAVQTILEALDDDQREVFVLAELEELGAPEIAEALSLNVNTVYSRLRLARRAFAEAAARHRARDGWRMR